MKTLVIALFIVFLAFSQQGYAQVAINSDGSAPHGSAMLDVVSPAASPKGILIPRMTSSDIPYINDQGSVETGLLIYQTDAPSGFYFFNGTLWSKLLESAGALSVSQGGTGNTSYTSGGIIFGGATLQSTLSTELFWNATTKRLGIGTANPNANLHVNGSFATKTTVATGTYTILNTDQIIVCNSASPFTVTLPAAGAGNAGTQYTIKNIGAGLVTVSPNLEGASKTLTQYQYVTVVSYGGAWYIVG